MSSLKLINSAAYLDIILKSNIFNKDIMGIIILADKTNSQLFYNKEAGSKIVEEYFNDQKIIKEEFEYLNKQIADSSLLESPEAELDDMFFTIIGYVESLKTEWKKQFSDFSPTNIEEALCYINNKKAGETIN